MSCASCSKGYVYDNATNRCIVCPRGTYQEKQIAFSCTPCPAGKTTLFQGAQSENDCLDTCLPGQWSQTGTAPCRPCPSGTYQSQAAMTSCDPCPFGMSSSSGANSKTDCQFQNLGLVEGGFSPSIRYVPGIESFTFLGWVHDTSPDPEVALGFSLSLVRMETSRAYISLADTALVIQPEISDTRKMVRKWYHVAVTYKDGTVTLYVDGKLTSTIGEGQLILPDFRDASLTFKASQNVSSITVSGLQMTNRALLAREIEEVASSCNKVVEPNLLQGNVQDFSLVSPSTCDDKNRCEGNPCGEFGTCIDGPGDDFICLCHGLWSGDRCQVAFNYCADHRCQNGATCVNQPESQNVSCVCPPGFKGLLCADPSQKGAWTEWTPCSVTCGGGVSTRTRLCDASITDTVEGECNKTQTTICNTQRCPECKPPELRLGRWDCTEDKEEGQLTCELQCPTGTVLDPPDAPNIFRCSRVTGYIWSHQAKSNPVGLLPECTPKQAPSALVPIIRVSYDVDCSTPSPVVDKMKTTVEERISGLQCSLEDVCYQKLTAVSSCESRKRSTGTVTLTVSLLVNTLNPALRYMKDLSEQESDNITKKLQSIEDSLVHMVNKSDEFFKVEGEDGEIFSGKLDEAKVTVNCPDGSGFLDGFCVDCPAGSYSLGNGTCEQCEKGMYQDKTRQSSCLPCPNGTSTSGVGSYSVSHCTADPLSFYDITPEYIDV